MATKRSSMALKFDKLYKAIGAGERTSSKFATIYKTDGTRFRRRNANQYGEAEGGNDYVENRVNRTDVYPKDKRKKVMAEGGNTGSEFMKAGGKAGLTRGIKKDLVGLYTADRNKALDKNLKAKAKGKRKSKKFATIEMRDGSKFRRRNANQYGEAEGGLNYYESRPNRSDKSVWLERGATLKGKKKKTGKKVKQPKVVRQYFEDTPSEYAMGGNTGGFNYSIGGL